MLDSSKEFNKNVIKVLSGTVLAQALPIAVAPILTRIYSPENFGIFALFYAIVSIFGVMATGRYELSVILPKSKNEAIHLTFLSLMISVLLSLIFFLLIFFFKERIMLIINTPEFEPFLYLLPLSILCVGVYQSLYYFINREKKYSQMGRSKIVQGTSTAFAQLAFGFIGLLKISGLIIGYLFGQIASIFYIIFILISQKENFKKINLKLVLSLAKKYSNFPKFSLVGNTLNTVSRQLPNIFANVFYSATSAGFYIVIQRVISTPLSIIGSSVADVFRQKASESFQKHNNCQADFLETVKKLFFIAVIPFTLFGIYAEQIFIIIFGADWAIAGQYAQLLTPMFFLQFIITPVSYVYTITHNQKEDMIIQIFTVIFICIIFSIGLSFKSSLVAFSIFFFMVYLFVFFRAFHFSKGSKHNKIQSAYEK